jgi:hypothetical protein
MSKLSIGASFAIIVWSFSGEAMTGRCLWFLCGNSSFTSENRGEVGLGSGKLWYTVKLGWCVGSNPPFVFCGIRLIGLPALSGRFLISVCLPFPLAGRPFHRSTMAHSTLRMPHRQVQGGRVVSAPLPRLSPYPRRDCNSTRGRSFLIPRRERKPHTNSPAHHKIGNRNQINIPTKTP